MSDEKLDKIIQLLEQLIANPQPCTKCGRRGQPMQCGECHDCTAMRHRVDEAMRKELDTWRK